MWIPTAETSCVPESLFDLAQVLIQPSDYLPDEVGSLLRHIMGGVESESLFVGRGCAEHLKQRILAQENPVVLAANHQHRRLEAWREVGSVRSRQRRPFEKSSIQENHGLEPVVQGRQD